METHGKAEKHSHKTNRSFTSPHLLQERDEGEKRLHRDLSFEHVASNQLQAWESLLRQITPEVQRPKVTTQTSLALAPCQYVSHVAIRNCWELMLRQRAFLLKEQEGFSHVFGVALMVDLPF